MINIEMKSTGDIGICLLVCGFIHSLPRLKGFKKILGDVGTLLHRQDVVGCDVFEYFLTCAVSIADEIELTAEIV